jgi:hypothetical protein
VVSQGHFTAPAEAVRAEHREPHAEQLASRTVSFLSDERAVRLQSTTPRPVIRARKVPDMQTTPTIHPDKRPHALRPRSNARIRADVDGRVARRRRPIVSSDGDRHDRRHEAGPIRGR